MLFRCLCTVQQILKVCKIYLVCLVVLVKILIVICSLDHWLLTNAVCLLGVAWS